VIQRGLILLTNHLESFRKRYAFHLRMWQLDGAGISSHQKSQQDKQSVSIRVILQPGGTSEKVRAPSEGLVSLLWQFVIVIFTQAVSNGCMFVDFPSSYWTLEMILPPPSSSLE